MALIESMRGMLYVYICVFSFEVLERQAPDWTERKGAGKGMVNNGIE